MPPQGVQWTHWSQGRIPRPQEARLDGPCAPLSPGLRGPDTCAGVVVKLSGHFSSASTRKTKLQNNCTEHERLTTTDRGWWLDAKLVDSSTVGFDVSQQHATQHDSWRIRQNLRALSVRAIFLHGPVLLRVYISMPFSCSF